MAEIPISSVVTVNISTTPTAPSRAGFGTMLLITQETGVIGPIEGIRYYSSDDEVAADWAADSEVRKASTTHFSQVPSPDVLAVGVRYIADVAGFLRSSGNAEDAFSVWAAVTDGEFTISIDESAEDITTVNFTGDADMDDVAATLQTALQAIGTGGYTAATCTWDAVGTVFNITSGTSGASSSVSFMTPLAVPSGTDISGAGQPGTATAFFQGRQGQGTKSPGIAAEANVQDALDRLNEGNDWYGFSFTKETRDNQDVQDASAWAEARIKQFYTTSNNEDTLASGVDTDISSVLNLAARRRTFVEFSQYPDEYPEISAFARAATVSFTLDNSTITLKFKQLPGITPENITSAQVGIIKGKGANVYTTVGGVDMLQEGIMSKGVGTWQDTVHGVDWLQNAIETNVFTRLYQAITKVPLTDKGGQTLVQEVTSALGEGVRNGLIAPGYDIDGNFLPTGYVVTAQPVAEINASDIAMRVGPNIFFRAIGAGAIHGLTITGVFEG